MRIAIDLQSCQTETSKNRGIGTYSRSLVRALLANGAGHEFWLALNGNFPESVEEVCASFSDLIEAERIRAWQAPANVIGPNNAHRRAIAETVRTAFLANLRPDFIYVTSVFEGLLDAALTSIDPAACGAQHAATLYDLIPLSNSEQYLGDNAEVRRWYFRNLQNLKRADLLFAISEFSRQEAIQRLNISPDRIINISGAVDPLFAPRLLNDDSLRRLRAKYGLTRPFLMYTGGIDLRKNIEGLVQAFAQLPRFIQNTHQLAIVCAIKPREREHLEGVARTAGLTPGGVVLTGFVPQAELVELYNACELFVFPSLYEGFGLPALEAMSCGAATIGGNNSSIPEIIGLDAALFDASRPADIAKKILETLSDNDFRRHLQQHSVEQAKKFTWRESASRVLAAMEAQFAVLGGVSTPRPASREVMRLAFVAPLPPSRTGVAQYSAELLRELCRYYDIDIVCDESELADPWVKSNFRRINTDTFIENFSVYDRVIYQFGNSHFHERMPEMLDTCPGVVVLHDFFLSGLQSWLARAEGLGYFLRNLLYSDGYPALDTFSKHGEGETVARHTMNAGVINRAVSVIVHSKGVYSTLLRESGLQADEDVHYIPHIRAITISSAESAREALKIPKGVTLVCAFGFVARTKMNVPLLEAFATSELARDRNCWLVFVGENDQGEYGRALLEKIKAAPVRGKIRITGFASREQYQTYLAAADIAVQLRANSRGETSGAVLDCLAHGLPTIVNAHGAMADLDDGAVFKLSDVFEPSELRSALEQLWRDKALRSRLADRARGVIAADHAPERVGRSYRDAVERGYASSLWARRRRSNQRVSRQLSEGAIALSDVVGVAGDLAANSPSPGAKRFFLDVTGLAAGLVDHGEAAKSLAETLAQPRDGWRVELVHAVREEDWIGYRLARRFGASILGVSRFHFDEDVLDPRPGDVFVGLGLNSTRRAMGAALDRLELWRTRGTKFFFWVPTAPERLDAVDRQKPSFDPVEEEWLEFAATVADGLICGSESAARGLYRWLESAKPTRRQTLRVAWLSEEHGAATRSSAEWAGANSALASFDDLPPVSELLDLIQDDTWPLTWQPTGNSNYRAGSTGVTTQVGLRDGRAIRPGGAEGFLARSPQQSMPAGRYEARLFGSLGRGGAGDAILDVAVDGGRRSLAKLGLEDRREGQIASTRLASLRFELAQPWSDVEIRLFVTDASDLSFSRFEIIPDASSSDAGLLSDAPAALRPSDDEGGKAG